MGRNVDLQRSPAQRENEKEEIVSQSFCHADHVFLQRWKIQSERENDRVPHKRVDNPILGRSVAIAALQTVPP